MSNVLNRTTKRYLKSVNTPEYPVSDWIINPDLSAVTGFASKYWAISGDAVSLLDQSARDAIDAAENAARLDVVADELDQPETVMRAFAEVVVDEINLLRAQHGLADRTLSQLKASVRGKL